MQRVAAHVVALTATLWLTAAAVADTPMPSPRPQGAPAASRTVDAVPSPVSDDAAAGGSPPADASALPTPKALGSTPVLPAGLTPAAVAAAAKRRPAPPTAAVPPAAPSESQPAAATATAPPGPDTPAPSTSATVATPLPPRRPVTQTATVEAPTAPLAAPAATPSPDATPEATANAPATLPPAAVTETPATVAGAAPALPRPAPDRSVATAAAPADEAPAAEEPATPEETPATLAYAPAPGEAKPPVRWGGRDAKLLAGRPAALSGAAAPSAAAGAATPPPTPPGAAPIEAAEPAATPPKVATAPASRGCAALMALGPAVVEAAPDLPQTGACAVERPVRLKAVKMPDGRLVTLSPTAELRCDMAAAAFDWLRDDLVPALETGGSQVVVVKVADDYSCRPRNRVRGAKLSEHGRGNAIDIGGFKVADGRVLEIAGNGLPKPFRVTMRATACARFKTILGPGSDGYHENHIHVDLAPRRSKRSYCRWRIPGTDAS